MGSHVAEEANGRSVGSLADCTCCTGGKKQSGLILNSKVLTCKRLKHFNLV